MVVFNSLHIPFLWIGTILAFFHSKGNLPLHKHILKINLKGLQIESPHIFNIRILTLSYPLILFGSSLLVVWRMPSFVKEQEDSVLPVRNGYSEGEILPFKIGKNGSVKRELKISLFFLKVSNIFIITNV